VRFSAVAAWIPLGLAFAWKKSESGVEMARHVVGCAWWGVLGILGSCLLDRFFYGFWAAPFLASFHFNVWEGNGSLYGTHPFHWYIFCGLPAISGILLPFLLHQFSSTLAKPCSTNVIFISILFSYIAAHSFSAHKEFRFLLPILPFVCLLSAKSLHSLASSRGNIRVLLLLCLLNYPHLLYLLRVHQSAPIVINQRIVRAMRQDPRPSYSVHYLMPCHSSPLYSHLHLPGTRVDARTLDCSPDCRVDSSCESDSFLSDPRSFLLESYAGGRRVPDFLVVKSEDLGIGLRQVAKVPDAILGVGLRIGSLEFRLGDASLDERGFFAWDVARDFVYLHAKAA